jgi:hypothetical protein
MKKQTALALALVALVFSACNDENPIVPTPFDPFKTTREAEIRSVDPNAGAPGSAVAILGENFAPTISENYVTFSSSTAEVTYVSEGMLNVIVPNLADGDYEITVYTGGQVRRAPQMFTVINSKP